MSREARLKKTNQGLVPRGKGWFAVNAKKARWFRNEKFGAACIFEGQGKARFSQIGVNIHVLQPGQPNCHYHAESTQEDFLVLRGRCILLVEGRKKKLKAWDFVHCPPGTEHVFVGAGKSPCAILMMGARGNKKGWVRYPKSALAMKYGAGAKKATRSPRESYAGCPPWNPAKIKVPLK
jgi:uncharacterized cupin superfamily protein